MIKKDGSEAQVRTGSHGKPVMVARLIFLEPAMWDMFDRLATNNKKTRSTFIRCDLKDHRRSKMDGVDWSESNKR